MPAIRESTRVCESCGSPVETTSSDDLGCMVCLIDVGLDAGAAENDGGFAPVPDQLGAYTVEHHVDGSVWELGHGAMGVTYRATDKALDRPVALKIINTNLGSRSVEVRQRFMREARAAAALRHPNVATVYQFGVREETGQFFYAMELVEGETLEERVGRLGPLDVLAAIDVALQVTAALAAAEQHGLVHRDLKPGNLMFVSAGETEESNGMVMVGTDRRAVRSRRAQRSRPTTTASLTVKVIDFGVAKAAAEKTNAMSLTQGGFVGTPAFASPEQFTNTPVDVRSDIYSLGVTLWFLLTGHMLFSGRTIDEIREARRSISLPISQLETAQVPRRFVSLLVSMLAIEPAARPAGARELGARLEAIRGQITTRPKIAQRLAVAAAVFALVAIVAVRVFQSFSTKPASVAVPEKSVAVLPLENLSDEKENAFFADGIQDELLSNLAKIKDLKVISRTSVMQYKSGSTRNLKEIAQQLGVGNIVEGSVRRAGNRVRVSVQLIDALTDRHIWVQNYDRTLADSLALQGELATEIAAGVGATLSPQEKARVKAKPTNNPAAYDAYLRGRAFAAGSPWDKSTVENAIQSYQEAVKLDPNFVLAWAYLSCAQSGSYWNGVDPSPAQLAAAKDSADRALALDPNLSETHLALGYYRYWGQHDFTGGLAEFQQAEKGLPNNVDITNAIALVQRRLGHWEEAIDEFRRVVELDPRDTTAYISLAVTYSVLRRFPEALATVERVLAWEPANADALGLKASVFWATGDLQAVEPLLANSGTEPRVPGGATSVRGVQALFQRRYAAAIEIFSSVVAAKTKRGEPSDDEKLDLGLSQQRAGDVSAARATYQSALQDFLHELEKVAPGSPAEEGTHAALGLAHAGLGEAASAIAEGQKAMAIYPTSKDPFGGPEEEKNMADIYALLGDADHAIPILKRLLQIPCGFVITPALLRLDPVWDQIRNDPRFEKLAAAPPPKAADK